MELGKDYLGKLQGLILLLKQHGVTQYKDGSLELQLGAATGTNRPAEEVVPYEPRRKTPQELEVERQLKELPPAYNRAFHHSL